MTVTLPQGWNIDIAPYVLPNLKYNLLSVRDDIKSRARAIHPPWGICFSPKLDEYP